MQAKKSRQERNLCLVAENFTVSEAASQEVCKFCHLMSLPAVTNRRSCSRYLRTGEWNLRLRGSVGAKPRSNRSQDRYGKLPTCSLRFSAQPRGADFRSGIAAVPTAAACEPEAFAVKRAPRLKWRSLKTASLGFCWEHPPTCARKSKPRLSCVRATEFANRPSPEQSS